MIAIVDYKAGNLTSVKRALDHLGLESCITPDPSVVAQAERIIFPGVGHAGTAMAVLKERGLDAALRAAYEAGTPILGTCVGAQIILSHSEEGDTACLGLVAGDCVRFQPDDPTLKVPHMGWNEVRQVTGKNHPVLQGVPDGAEFYFVHSYYLRPADPAHVLATTEHGLTFPAIIGQHNLVATQFHSEKSGPVGLAILKNFAVWNGAPC
jgi:imidazole glycerol-phosphate synthase subunit HisH